MNTSILTTHILRAWGANMELQMVGSVYGAAQYVCHYMSKDEPKELRQLISHNLEKLPINFTQKSRLLKIGNTLISHRILSAQEAVYQTTGLHLFTWMFERYNICEYGKASQKNESNKIN